MNPACENIFVVVIDDDRMVLGSMLDFLDDVGFRTAGFTEPEEALQMIRSSRPDLCLVDLRLSGTTGEQLIKEIVKSSPGIRCLIYTGSYYLISDELKGLGMSQDDVIQKPVQDFELLSEKLWACCRRK